MRAAYAGSVQFFQKSLGVVGYPAAVLQNGVPLTEPRGFSAPLKPLPGGLKIADLCYKSLSPGFGLRAFPYGAVHADGPLTRAPYGLLLFLIRRAVSIDGLLLCFERCPFPAAEHPAVGEPLV